MAKEKDQQAVWLANLLLYGLRAAANEGEEVIPVVPVKPQFWFVDFTHEDGNGGLLFKSIYVSGTTIQEALVTGLMWATDALDGAPIYIYKVSPAPDGVDTSEIHEGVIVDDPDGKNTLHWAATTEWREITQEDVYDET